MSQDAVTEKKDLSKKPAENEIKKDAETGKELIHVKIYSPFQTYYDQDAFSLSGENETGPFDVLPRHHNFITLLNEGEILVRAPGGESRFKIAKAVMHIKANFVTIFLDV